MFVPSSSSLKVMSSPLVFRASQARNIKIYQDHQGSLPKAWRMSQSHRPGWEFRSHEIDPAVEVFESLRSHRSSPLPWLQIWDLDSCLSGCNIKSIATSSSTCRMTKCYKMLDSVSSILRQRGGKATNQVPSQQVKKNPQKQHLWVAHVQHLGCCLRRPFPTTGCQSPGFLRRRSDTAKPKEKHLVLLRMDGWNGLETWEQLTKKKMGNDWHNNNNNNNSNNNNNNSMIICHLILSWIIIVWNYWEMRGIYPMYPSLRYWFCAVVGELWDNDGWIGDFTNNILVARDNA